MTQRTHEAPSRTVSTGSVGVPVGTVALVFGQDDSRRAATIVNQGTQPVWLAATQTREPSNGFYLPAGAGYVWTSTAPAFAFVAAGAGADGLLYVIAESGEA
jgi:hypothetical protein